MNNLRLRNFLQLNLGHWLSLRTSYIMSRNLMHVHKSNIILNSHSQGFYNQSINELYVYRQQNNNKTTEISYLMSKTSSILSHQLQNINNWTSFLNKSNHISYAYRINNLLVFEQSWLVNPNLRLNINTVYKRGKCICVSFSSDIKIV
uniref:Uncharacterized protein n=1 Tax=Liagora brachyclada TaxID=1884665 RepID=A0A1G4P048_9FLOR|nr:Hypothetical protein ycf58 [Liagora brachyclada]SCW24189.1 Hypothetical protein ycf58 [Liagora brachyclada]